VENSQSVVAKELAYYRAHFREAVQKDGVICVECGAIFKYLPGHLCKHNLSSHDYRAKWGYNRTTPLERLSTRRKKGRNALAMKLWKFTPPNSHHKATKARRGHGLPCRPEKRLVTTEAARARVAAGFRLPGLRGKDKIAKKNLQAKGQLHVRKPIRVSARFNLSKEDLKILTLAKEDSGLARSHRV
jgi:ROS/MUCR transcriptional regulator protein